MVIPLTNSMITAFADVPSALSRANPVIQISEYEIMSENIEPDGEFTIKITVRNNNSYATAYNVVCEAQTPDMDLHLTDGQVNQVYFQSIAPDETVSFSKSFAILAKSLPKSLLNTFAWRAKSESV